MAKPMNRSSGSKSSGRPDESPFTPKREMMLSFRTANSGFSRSATPKSTASCWQIAERSERTSERSVFTPLRVVAEVLAVKGLAENLASYLCALLTELRFLSYSSATVSRTAL